MCKVKVSPESKLQPIAVNERRKLAGLDDEYIRLSCQARAAGKVGVEEQVDPLKAAIARQLARQAEEDDKLW
ncbi:hypothetical protein D3C80_1733080 [compost metagenome]